MTTSHLTTPANNAGQVIGYSHSTDGTTSHSTKRVNNTRQVAGYKRAKTCAKWLVIFAIGLTTTTLAGAAELGRLFFTPEQRAQLDYGYAQDSDSNNNNRTLMLNGIVQQHGGKRTVWINGVPQPVGSSDDKTPESQSVQVPGKTGSVKLKVGQRVLLDPAATPDTTRPDTPDTPKQ